MADCQYEQKRFSSYPSGITGEIEVRNVMSDEEREKLKKQAEEIDNAYAKTNC